MSPLLRVVSEHNATAKPRMSFKPGSEVTIRSNPEVVMTVENSDAKTTACWWVDEAGNYQAVRFPTVILKRHAALRK